MQDLTNSNKSTETAEKQGLRNRKKVRQHASILEVALRLFREQGYDKVRMEDIAVEAEVATKTVYNYFPAKSDLLIEFLRSDRDRAIPRYKVILKNSGLPADAAVVALMRSDLGNLNAEADRAFWLEVMSVAVKARGDERFRHHRHLFVDFLEKLLRKKIVEGQLDPALDVPLAAEVLHAIYSEHFLAFCADPSLPQAGWERSLRSAVKLTLGSWIRVSP